MDDTPDTPEAAERPSAEDELLAAALRDGLPAPSAGFRVALAQRIAALDPGYGHRPPALWRRGGALLGGGAGLVLVGALIAVGAL